MLKTVCMFGRIPPPVGGVTKSVENYFNALVSSGINVDFLSYKSLFKRYDLVHIHYYFPYKRFIASLIGRIIAKKTIFTLHGSRFDEANLLNILTLKLVDGVILLNETILERNKPLFKKNKVRYVILTSLLKEGIHKNTSSETYFERETEFKYLLLYAYDKYLFNGRDCYGVDLILENIKAFNGQYKIVLLDPKAKYKSDIKHLNSDNIIYIPQTVDFFNLLQQIDIYIRPTQTDGRSVAVQEALFMKIPVLASDIITRLPQVVTYKNNDFKDFYLKLRSIKSNPGEVRLSSINDYNSFFVKL